MLDDSYFGMSLSNQKRFIVNTFLRQRTSKNVPWVLGVLWRIFVEENKQFVCVYRCIFDKNWRDGHILTLRFRINEIFVFFAIVRTQEYKDAIEKRKKSDLIEPLFINWKFFFQKNLYVTSS